jgi:hypothetical protein
VTHNEPQDVAVALGRRGVARASGEAQRRGRGSIDEIRSHIMARTVRLVEPAPRPLDEADEGHVAADVRDVPDVEEPKVHEREQ